MKNIFLDSIYKLEILNLNKIKRRSLINRVMTRLFRLTRYQKHFIPNENLCEKVKTSSSKISIQIEKKFFSSELDKEIEKSILRLDLRYKTSQYKLLVQLLSQALDRTVTPLKFYKYKYVSPFYPIVHLPKDYSEEGKIHNDFLGYGFFGTSLIWLPFTNYDYPGIITKSKSSRFLAHFLGKNLGQKVLERSPDLYLKKCFKSGEWVCWNDTFYHKGIINRSNNIAVALVTRFSKDINKESFISIKEIKENFNLQNSTDLDYTDELVTKTQYLFRDFMYKVKDNYLSEEISQNKMICFLKDSLANNSNPKYNIFKFHVFEFAFSLISLRVQTKPNVKWLNDKDYDYFKLNSYLIDLQNNLKTFKEDYLQSNQYI